LPRQARDKPYETFTQDTCSLVVAPVALYIAVQVEGLANVCLEALCVQRASECCKKVHPCGHPCGGVAGEEICMPCLEGCDTTITHYADADDFCQICWTESLSAAPSIRLGCGHVMHYHCGV
jgi:E3 ubiquitin-protein ligase MYCBP2